MVHDESIDVKNIENVATEYQNYTALLKYITDVNDLCSNFFANILRQIITFFYLFL